jgi:hypothetical protein
MVASLDIAQAQRHIELLGLGTKVFLRGFYHSDDPRKNEDKGRKLNSLDIKQIESWIADKRGVYLVVNGGGHEDKNVPVGCAIFCEHDDLDKELQLTLWKNLGLPQPTFQVDTGGKSIHSYWVLDFPIPIEDWRKLQADLLEFADADRSIKNPSRVMRLAGACHQNGNRSEIISDSGQQYSYEQLRSLIPEQTTAAPKTSYQPSISDDVPLYNCLSKDDRQLIDSGVVQGGRNSAGAKLARNLIGTAKRLDYLGHRYEGSSKGLFDLFCSRCSPRLEDKEAEQIWKSAEKDNPTATLTDDALENCIKAFHNQSKTPKVNAKSDIKNPSQSQSQLSQKSTIREDLKGLINSNLPESEQEERLQEIAKQHDKSDGQINRLFKSILKESESNEQLEQHKAELEQLLKIDSQTIRLSEYLHPHLAKPLAQISQWLGMPESAMLTVLLPVAASLMPIDTRLELIKSTEFYAHPILYTGLVGESGIGKTPVLKKIISPLYSMQSEALTEHNQAMEDWEQACNLAEKNKEPKPPQPKLHNYFTTDATTEAIAKIQNDQPTKGFVGYFDELEGLFKGANQYRSGRGNDTEKMLSGRDGTGFKVDRSNGKQLFVEKSGYSITGGIQPDVLRKRYGDLSDSNGQWARFIWDDLSKTEPAPYPESDICYNSNELLREIYQKLERQSAITHILLPDAKQQYSQWYSATR